MRRKLHKNQLGDTIVEIMIAMVVLSLAISGAYAIASRSLKNARQAQERSEALKLAESQVERIKSMAAEGTAGLFATQNFCLNPGVTVGNCLFNDLYTVNITSTGLDSDRHHFTVNVTWNSLIDSGAGVDQLTMHYRVIDESGL